MLRALTQLPWLIGVLIVGMLAGSLLAGTPTLWWGIIALAVIAIAGQIAGMLYRSRRASQPT